jgi:serine protease Do
MKSAVGRGVLTFLAVGTIWLGAQTFAPLATVGGLGLAPQVSAAPAAQAAPSLQDFSASIKQVSDKVRPAIVQITSNQNAPAGPGQPAGPQATGVGSGVIYDNQGHILTNNHVVEGADSLTVSLPDGRSFDGKLIGADPLTDLAVVQITSDNLPMAALGDSSKLGVGDWLVAIGNALALPGGPTVTVGVASALGRSQQEPDAQGNPGGPVLYDLIQTDAAINPGNSGGALTNLNGEVVGINTLVAGTDPSGIQAQGIGFAISMNTAKPIADQLVATGKAVHPFIGISYSALTPAMAKQFGVPSATKGIFVAQVVAGSPAAQAGLKQNDVVTQVDNQPIVDESTLGRYLISKKPGDTITLTVQRGAQSMQLSITLANRPAGQ